MSGLATAMKTSVAVRASALARGQQYPLDPRGEAHPGRGRPAELLDQAVVAAAAAERGLGAQPSDSNSNTVRV